MYRASPRPYCSLEVLRHVELGQALTAYALHEWRGRYGSYLPAEAEQLSVVTARFYAVLFLLENRTEIVAALLAAGIIDCLTVRVSAPDIPSIRVMGADPLSNFSKNKLAEVDTDGSGSADYVRRLAASPARIEGPILALARDTAGPITLFEGMHRMAAWVAHVNAGRQYPVEITLVLTEHAAPRWELPAPT